jgi:hypothetical protein
MRVLAFTSLLVLVSGCDLTIPPGGGGGGGGTPPSPYQEIYEAGLTRYVGTPEVQPSSVTTGGYVRIDVHHFESEVNGRRGPVCMRGHEFFTETREGESDELLIFLEMGGVCLNEICGATADPTLNLRTFTTGDLIGLGGILDRTDDDNPLADADVVHIPYCDGSIFMGDVDRPLSDGNAWNGTNDQAFQRGLLNLTASLEVSKREFPSPSRIVLAGSSGGAYGVIAATALARHYYPNTEIIVVSDSGAPILREQDPDFVRRVLGEINALQYIPASCPDCIANGHVTRVLEWALERDANLRVATMTHIHDGVIGASFMQSTPAAFGSAWLRESDRLAARFPGRYNRLIAPGDRHTFLLDIGLVPDALAEAALYAFGPVLFTGDSFTRTDLAGWKIGDMDEALVDEYGRETTPTHWLTTLLRDRANAYDIVNP